MDNVPEELLTQQLNEIDGVELDPQVTFADLTTLRIGGSPRACVRAATPEAAAQAIAAIDASRAPLVIVGGGSNLVVADGQLDYVAVLLDFDAMAIDAESGIVRAQAGANWDAVVAATVEAGLGGIECLSGIPGNAGAVPVQNVGAYGAEISDVLTQVKLYHRESGQTEWVPAADLELAYRYSNLKFTGRAVVLEIELQLTTDGLSRPLRFGQLTDTPGEQRPVADVRDQVLSLRRGKGMVLDASDHDTWSAGSFFTNPIVDSAVADSIQAATGEDSMPRHVVSAVSSGSADSAVSGGNGEIGPQEKLSAAWLIQRAGFDKGYPGHGAATLSTKHTLALTNRGGASADDIVRLARDIRAGVQEAFGVELVPEPVWLGVSI